MKAQAWQDGKGTNRRRKSEDGINYNRRETGGIKH
jgi:hypothetical protein